MALKLKYGSYVHEAGECAVIITRQALLSGHGVYPGFRERWDVQGRLHASTQAAVSTSINALQAAYKIHNQAIGLYFESGTPTSHVLNPLSTMGGTRVAQPPSFPEGRGAEYSTFRNYTLAVEAEVYDYSEPLLSWTEVLSFQGDAGPTWGFLLPINAAPQKQLFTQASTQTVTQRGMAIGNNQYISAPGPLWPEHEHAELRVIEHELPATNTKERVTRWSYAFEAAAPQSASPTTSPIN